MRRNSSFGKPVSCYSGLSAYSCISYLQLYVLGSGYCVLEARVWGCSAVSVRVIILKAAHRTGPRWGVAVAYVATYAALAALTGACGTLHCPRTSVSPAGVAAAPASSPTSVVRLLVHRVAHGHRNCSRPVDGWGSARTRSRSIGTSPYIAPQPAPG